MVRGFFCGAQAGRPNPTAIRPTQLGDTAGADDTFQAVFLVLARRASSIRQRELLGPWLYAVATRSARRERALRQRRQSRERFVETMPEYCDEPDEPRDWLPLLDD